MNDGIDPDILENLLEVLAERGVFMTDETREPILTFAKELTEMRKGLIKAAVNDLARMLTPPR